MARDCARFHDDLSGFVDETLPSRRWGEIARHLAGCPLCREETVELREVRSALANAQRDDALPSTLTSRLEAIAGDDSCQPLYLRPSPDSAPVPLPSKRRRRQRIALRGTMAVMVLALSMAVLAVALAPEPRNIDDAVASAREQFAEQITAINVQGAVGAVLLAQNRGAQLASIDGVHGLAVDQATSLPISHGAAEKVLSRSAEAPVALSGVQEVLVARDDGGYWKSDVAVQRVAGEGANLAVHDRLGNQFLSSFAPDFAPEIFSSKPSSLSNWDFFTYPGLTTLAGRDATVLEARAKEAVVARWWFDVSTGVVLRSERFDSSEHPTIIVAYRSLRLGEARLPERREEMVPLSKVGNSGTRGWCVGLPVCPSELAGLPLVAYSSTTARGERSMGLFYSDGLQTLTVTWTEGRLDGANRLSADAAAGLPSVSVWQSGTGVVALATNGSRRMLDDAAHALPGQADHPTGISYRLGVGLARLTGLN